MPTYITPNSKIKILRNVPLDDTYDHTIIFLSSSAQEVYFTSKVKYSLGEQTYQRVQRGWIRVGIEADNLYDCNYLMFQNTDFGDKWFYAFIKSVEYINNGVSEIEYEIDVMQTWHFNYTLDKCWVEREHCASGDIAPLFTAEPLDPGTMMYNSYNVLDLNTWNVAIIYLPQDVHARYINNTFFGASCMTGLPASATADIQTIITQIIENHGKIINMYQYPAGFYDPINPNTPTTQTVTVSRPTTVSGYTPRNKKLLYYPYSYLRVSAQNGKYQDYVYEYFSSVDLTFKIRGVIVPEAKLAVYPLSYKRVEECYEEKMIISDFPVCAWNVDTYTQWWANNQYGIFIDGIAHAINMLTTLNPVRGATNITDYALNVAKEEVTALTAPDNVYGNTNSGNLNAALGEQKIKFYKMGIQPQRAETIDTYFDRFGYACNRNKVPNRAVRPHWCYTKTQGCTITGSVPADHASAICKIYNHGVTFWKNGNEVGNYNLDNRINEG